jgi:hypothetical protein
MSTAIDHHSPHSPRVTSLPVGLAAVYLVFVVGLVSVGLGAAVALAATHSHGLIYLIGGLTSATILGVLFAIPVRLLPSITLLVTLLIPTDTTLLPHLLQGSALGVIPLAVWMIRAPTSTTTPSILRILAFLLGAWLVLSEIFAPLHTHHGLEWLLVAGITMVFAVLTAPTGLKPQSFRSLFLAVATILGVYALLEGVFIHHNILFGFLFEHDTWWATVQGNVSYRVTTLLGHPLINGTVFSAAAVLAASDVMQKPQRLRVALIRLMILVAAVATTHSRGAAIALAVGLLMVIVFSRGRGEGQGTRRLVLITGAILGATLLIYGLQARDESRGGQQSAAVRVNVIKRASETLHGLEPFGAGPGESEAYRTAKQLPGWQLDLENSYAEVAVSLGPIGLLLVVALLIAIVVLGLQNDLVVGEAAALFTLAVDIGGFNAIEDQKSVLVIIGLFIISIITAQRSFATSQGDYASASGQPVNLHPAQSTLTHSPV